MSLPAVVYRFLPPDDLKRERGFTILELLVSVTIFMVVATLLYGLVAKSMGLWKQGEERREIYEFGQAVLSRIATDLRNIHTGGIPLFADLDVKLIADVDARQRPRLRFVRTLGATEKALYRSSGARQGPTDVMDLNDDAKEVFDGTLKPSRGLMEVVYTVLPLERAMEEERNLRLELGLEEADPQEVAQMQTLNGKKEEKEPPSGALVLYRGIRSPIGGNRSLFALEELDEASLIVRVAKPLAYGVLHMGLEYAGNGPGDFDQPLDVGGADVIWDSTRGILPEFALSIGPGSVEDPRDDLFPRAIRVTLVLERPDRARVTSLRKRLSATDMRLEILDPSILPRKGSAFPYVKVGEEWIEVGAVKGRTVTIVRRGMRETVATAHQAKAPVRVGITFRKVVPMVSYREHVANQ